MAQQRTISSSRARAGAPLALAAACGLTLAAPVAAQLTEPFPAVFDLESLSPARGGDGSLGFVLQGDEERSLFGAAIDSAGDINGDGIDDVLVGAEGYSTVGYYGYTLVEGRAYVIFGRDQTVRGFPALLEIAAMAPDDGIRFERSFRAEDQLGSSVAGLGDINGDGQDDVAIAARTEGTTYIVFGSDGSSGSGLPPVFELNGLGPENGFRFNASVRVVRSAGDLNNDAAPDIAISNSASNYIVFGRPGGGFPSPLHYLNLDGTNGFSLRHTGSLAAVTVAGDINGDGVTDLVAGDYRADPAGVPDAGSTYIFYGRAGGSFAPEEWVGRPGEGFRADGVEEREWSGEFVSRAGDVNGDGADDFIIAANGRGKSYVVFGRDASGPGFPATLDLSTLDGRNGFVLEGPGVGADVACVGDVNSDGLEDLATTGSGEHHIVYGRDTTGGSAFPAVVQVAELTAEEGFRIRYDESPAFRAAGAGDINGDGVDDLILGAPVRYSGYEWGPGHAYVIFGRNPDAPCYADCDASGGLDFFDFLCFQNRFAAGDPQADCDASGELDFFDFLCFQNAFAARCP